jgi:hypothetical protein
MELVAFQSLRDGLTANIRPARGSDLDSAKAKLHKRLVASAMFAKVEIETTDVLDHLLIGLVHYRPGTSERQVAAYLEAVWVTELRLDGWDAFSFHVEKGHVELEAATRDTASTQFVTLQLIALEGSAADFAAPRVFESAADDMKVVKSRGLRAGHLRAGPPTRMPQRWVHAVPPGTERTLCGLSTHDLFGHDVAFEMIEPNLKCQKCQRLAEPA